MLSKDLKNKEGYNMNIIEEKVENTEVTFSEIYELFIKRILPGKEKNLFNDNDAMKLSKTEKNKFRIKGSFLVDLFYEKEKVNAPILVSFENNNKKNIYKICTQKYFDKKYNEMNFTNPILEIDNEFKNYDPKDFDLFNEFDKNKIFKIFEKNGDAYDDLYSKKVERGVECYPTSLTPNFQYYFEYPKTCCKMEFELSSERLQIINWIFNFKKEKIHSFFGPYGSGKTTTLLLGKNKYDNLCYLNLSALNVYKDNLIIWKYEILLKEFYNLFYAQEQKVEDSLNLSNDNLKQNEKIDDKEEMLNTGEDSENIKNENKEIKKNEKFEEYEKMIYADENKRELVSEEISSIKEDENINEIKNNNEYEDTEKHEDITTLNNESLKNNNKYEINIEKIKNKKMNNFKEIKQIDEIKNKEDINNKEINNNGEYQERSKTEVHSAKDEKMKNEKEDAFTEIKEIILKSNNFWEAIYLSIDFCIKKKIKSIFILDQYKEETDPNFKVYKDIKGCINKENNESVKLVIASSTNNQDIRNFIIQKYIDKLKKNTFINDYHYIQSIFKISDELLNNLSDLKKNIFEEYFSYIPSYYYIIYDSKEEDINKTLDNTKKIITDDIELFYKNNTISFDNLSFIIKNIPKIGVHLGKNQEDIPEKIDGDIIKKLINILPIKYFFLEIKDDSIINIEFYFNLAKICFLEYILTKIIKSFEQPKLPIPERTLGDFLELLTIEYFKHNSNEKIDQIAKVDSIWNMNKAEGFDINKINENNILLIQSDEKAKYIDFGFILNGEELILAQCKKALSSKPKDYITIKKISNYQKDIYNSFKEHFNCEIKKIKLFYITGIYFTNRDKNAFISWSKKNISFKTLEKITNENNIPLVFLDMEKKNLLIKNGNDNNSFDISTITNDFSAIRDEELFDYVKINKINEELENIFKGIKEQTKIQELKFNQKAEIVENIDEEGIKIYGKRNKKRN